MGQLAWSEELSVGVSALDADHRNLIVLINELAEAVGEGKGGAAVAGIMSRLRAHVDEHFQREEEVLERAGYPGAADHHGQHQGALQKMRELEQLARHSDDQAAHAVLDFLKAWFINHVVGSDLKMRDFLREKGLSDVKTLRRRSFLSTLARRSDFLSLKARIGLVIALPLLVITGLVVADVSTAIRSVDRQQDLIQLADFSTVSSALIHEMQKERGASALFLGSRGTKFGPELAEQRKLTDIRLAAFRDAAAQVAPQLPAEHAQRVAKSVAELEELPATRKATDAQSVAVPKVISYYTGAIANQIGVVEGMAHLAGDAEMALDLFAYTSVINAKERAGQERAVGSAGFAAGAFMPSLHRRLIELIAEQNAFFHSFRTAAAEAPLKALEAQRADDSERMVGNWRTVAIDSPVTGTLDNIQAPDWFKLTTRRIDKIKEVEDAAAAELITHAQGTLNQLVSDAWTKSLLLTALVIISAVFALTIVAGLVPPILAARDATKRLAQGDRTVEIPGQTMRDEIGDLSRAIQFFKEKLIQAEMAGALGNVENQSRIDAMTHREKAVHEFDQRMAKFVEEVGESAQSLLESANTMTQVAGETTSRSSAVAHAAGETSQRVQSTAAATEELAASIREIARQVQTQATATRDAAEQAARTNTQVESLVDSSHRIGEVVQLIRSIAAQTNMLALNATIEAARAGEAGKGFAVVANEVKALANQTAKATEEIVEQVNAIQEASRSSVDAIRSITDRIGGINEISAAVAAAVEEQEAATAEISRNVQDTSRSTDQVSANIGDVLNATERAEQAAIVVSDSAKTLNSHTEELRGEVRRFLAEMQG